MGALGRARSSGSDQIRRMGGAENGPEGKGGVRGGRGAADGVAPGAGELGSGGVATLTDESAAGTGSAVAMVQHAGAAG